MQAPGTESVSLNEDSTKCDDSFGSEKKFGLHDYFVSKEWHGPNVEAKLLAGPTDYGGKTVLICWHHENIPELAQGLRAVNTPSNWMSEVLDRIWVLEYQSAGEVYFQDLAQNLLQGDSKS